jgi:hypothetical protein
MAKILGFIPASSSEAIVDVGDGQQKLIDFGVRRTNIMIGKSESDDHVFSDFLDQLSSGDTLVVTSLDHLGRSVAAVVLIVLSLSNRNVKLVILPDPNRKGFSDKKLTYAIALLENTELSYHQVGLLLNVTPHILYRFVSPSGEMRFTDVRQLTKRLFKRQPT